MRAAAVIILLIVICILTLRRPFIGALAIVACAVLRDTLRVETYGAFFRYHGFEVLYIATIAAVFLVHTNRLNDFVPRGMTDWGMLGFLAIMVISAVVNGVNVFGHKYIDLFFKAVVLYFLLSRLADSPRRVLAVALVLVVCTSYLAYLAWSKFRDGTFSWARPYSSSQIHDFGLLLVITLPLIGALLAWRVWLPVRLVLFGLLPLFVLTTLRTTSRSAMLGAGFGIALLAWYHRKRWYWLVPAIPFVAYAIVHQPERIALRMESIWTHETETGEKDSSIASRFEQMRTALNVIKSNPLFGIGPRQYFMRYTDYQSEEDQMRHGQTVKYTMHSVPLLILCEEGLLGGAVYGMILLGALLDAWFVVRRTRGDPAMHAVGVIASGGLMCFIAFLGYSLGQPAMWVINIYATVALVRATRLTVEAHLRQAAYEREPVAGTPAPWMPRPATAETEVVFT